MATLKDTGKKIANAEIVRFGERLVLPEKMTLDQGIDLLQRRKEYEEETVNVSSKFNVFPWDGANALEAVLTEKFGWAPAEATPGFFGPQPPRMINIDVDFGKQKTVPWGRFSLPGVDGYIETGTAWEGQRMVFAISGKVKRKNEEIVKDIFDRVNKYLETNSIYQGKAIKIRFKDDDGDMLQMPEPKYLETVVDESMLVYPASVMEAVETSLFTPIRRWRDLQANNIPIKRGILLGGTFGTGKTLAAKVASKYAVENNVTYIYVPRADELNHAIEFAKQYSATCPAVIFCEDIDRSVGEDRTVSVDDILNIVDGIDSKNSNIIVVLTTNNLDGINQAMLRPGRLDAVIDVLPPDSEAIVKLIHIYGGDAIDKNADLSEVGEILNGTIPAVIAEVVKRAKLAQLKRIAPGEKVTRIGADALCESAMTMQSQIKLLQPKTEEEVPSLDQALRKVVKDAVSR